MAHLNLQLQWTVVQGHSNDSKAIRKHRRAVELLNHAKDSVQVALAAVVAARWRAPEISSATLAMHFISLQ